MSSNFNNEDLNYKIIVILEIIDNIKQKAIKSLESSETSKNIILNDFDFNSNTNENIELVRSLNITDNLKNKLEDILKEAKNFNINNVLLLKKMTEEAFDIAECL